MEVGPVAEHGHAQVALVEIDPTEAPAATGAAGRGLPQ